MLNGSCADVPCKQKLLLTVVGARVVGRIVGCGGNTFAGVVGDSVHVDVQSAGAPWYIWAIQFLSVIDNGDIGSRAITHVVGSFAVIVAPPLAENACGLYSKIYRNCTIKIYSDNDTCNALLNCNPIFLYILSRNIFKFDII